MVTDKTSLPVVADRQRAHRMSHDTCGDPCPWFRSTDGVHLDYCCHPKAPPEPDDRLGLVGPGEAPPSWCPQRGAVTMVAGPLFEGTWHRRQIVNRTTGEVVDQGTFDDQETADHWADLALQTLHEYHRGGHDIVATLVPKPSEPVRDTTPAPPPEAEPEPCTDCGRRPRWKYSGTTYCKTCEHKNGGHLAVAVDRDVLDQLVGPAAAQRIVDAGQTTAASGIDHCLLTKTPWDP